MPYAVKKPHPSKADVMLYHTWDPDGDGYEEIRKFPDEAKANLFAAEHAGAGKPGGPNNRILWTNRLKLPSTKQTPWLRIA